MSQQAQAEGQHQAALQNDAEIQGAIDALQARVDAGEVSGEALDAEVQRLNDEYDAVEVQFEQAAALNLLQDRATSLAGRIRQPAMIRPLTGGTPPGAADPAPAGADAPSHAELQRFHAAAELEDPASIGRLLLNQLLRPAEKSGGWGALSQQGREYLTRSHALQGEMATLLASPNADNLALTPYVDQAGGYVQGEQIWNQVVKIRDRATVLPNRIAIKSVVGGRLTIPTMQVAVSFTDGSKTTSASETALDLTEILGRTALTCHPARATLKIPEEYFMDPAFDAVGEIAREAERGSREDDETEILEGTGSGQPLGINVALKALYAAGATATARTPAAGASAVTADEIEEFDTYLHAGAIVNAVYVGPRAFIRKVRLMRTEEGGSGTGDRMFKRSNIAGGLPVLLEKEVITSEFFTDAITSGSVGDVMWFLGDLDDYWMAVQKTLELRILAELFANENMVGYKWTKYRDGCLVRADSFLYMRRGA